MRRREIFALAAVGMILVAPAAMSIAGDWYWGSTSGTYEAGETHPSMLGGSGEASQEPGTFESREPVEAGKIPSREGGMRSGGENRSGEESPTVEAGGLKFRLKIDAGA